MAELVMRAPLVRCVNSGGRIIQPSICLSFLTAVRALCFRDARGWESGQVGGRTRGARALLRGSWLHFKVSASNSTRSFVMARKSRCAWHQRLGLSRALWGFSTGAGAAKRGLNR